MENVVETNLPNEEQPSIWPPPPVAPPEAGARPNYRCQVWTGGVALDVFVGLFVGAVPLLLLLFFAAAFMLGDAVSDYPSNIGDVQIKGFLVLAAAFHGLLCRVCLRAFPGLLWGSLFAALLSCVYSVWLM